MKKKINSLCLGLLLGATTNVVARAAEPFRTDINPAQRYYLAFLMAPDLPPADRTYLYDNEWRGQKLPEHFGELVSRYENQFKLVRQAVHATVPCDWGIDLSAGPNTLLPHLARCKGVVQAARLRVMWQLQQGRQAEARDELIAAFELARNCARDGTLIGMLVQIASENIVYSTVAENFNQFSAESLKQLVKGFDAAPARITAVDCLPVEKAFAVGWLSDRIGELQKENPGNDSKVMSALSEIVSSFESGDESSSATPPQKRIWTQVAKASGGTSDGVLRLLHDMDPIYERLAVFLSLPETEFQAQSKTLSDEIQNSSNPFVPFLIPAVQKCRPKELAAVASQAMLRAAVEYKLNGDAGFNAVKDPFSQGAFQFQRFSFEGLDRGFELKSAYSGRGFQEAMIFVEMDGPPFHVAGPKAGQAVSRPDAK